MKIARFTPLLALAVLASGCDVLDDPRPESATLFIDGPAGEQVLLTISDKFVAAKPAAGPIEVELLESDVITVTLPFDTTVVFTPDLRVFFQAEGLEEGRTVRMRVWVDEESRFDVSRDPFINPMSFLFQYNGRLFGSDVNLL